MLGAACEPMTVRDFEPSSGHSVLWLHEHERVETFRRTQDCCDSANVCEESTASMVGNGATRDSATSLEGAPGVAAAPRSRSVARGTGQGVVDATLPFVGGSHEPARFLKGEQHGGRGRAARLDAIGP